MTAVSSPSGPAWPRRSRGSQTLGLLGFFVLVFAVEAAIVGVTRPAIDTWYAELAKPAFTPPNIAFPIVWTAIYVLMALAAWQAWRRAVPGEFGWAMACFLVQLALNLAWSYLFFGEQMVALALIDVVALLLAILATTVAFAQLSRWAGVLMLPYLAWVGFATVLNWQIWQLNYAA